MSDAKLYVANLPSDATAEGIRAHFSQAGGVADVEILEDRRGSYATTRAQVTMTSPAFTERALELDGVSFEGQPLRVSIDKRKRSSEKPPSKVKITQQFRGANTMTYELDCAGTPLSVRVLAGEGEAWVFEVGGGGTAGRCEAKTRLEALREAVAEWNGKSPTPVDAEAVIEAMKGVRAV